MSPLAAEESLSRELVDRHLRGDPEAFAQLVSLFSARVFNLALRFTGDRAEAEDLTQEAFLRAYAALPRSRTELPFRPWLLQITVNLCRDWARRQRPLAFSDLDGLDEADAGEPAAEQVADPDPLPPQAAEAHEQLADLRRAVLALPPDLRLLVTLRYNEELSYEQMAQLLHLPPATVGTSLLRARRRLRAALAAPDEADNL
jgi:RNA polymerase sigma-70 factor (ECF subfamily)